MKYFARRALRASLPSIGALALGSLSACGGPTAPEGATLRFQLRNVRTSAIDSLEIVLTPRGGETFTMVPTATYDGITVDVAEDGALEIVVPGDYVRTHAMSSGATDVNPVFELEVWSDDSTTNMAPQLRGNVLQAGTAIATGAGYVATWPLALGETQTIQVECIAGSAAACARE